MAMEKKRLRAQIIQLLNRLEKKRDRNYLYQKMKQQIVELQRLTQEYSSDEEDEIIKNDLLTVDKKIFAANKEKGNKLIDMNEFDIRGTDQEPMLSVSANIIAREVGDQERRTNKRVKIIYTIEGNKIDHQVRIEDSSVQNKMRLRETIEVSEPDQEEQLSSTRVSQEQEEETPNQYPRRRAHVIRSSTESEQSEGEQRTSVIKNGQQVQQQTKGQQRIVIHEKIRLSANHNLTPKERVIQKISRATSNPDSFGSNKSTRSKSGLGRCVKPTGELELRDRSPISSTTREADRTEASQQRGDEGEREEARTPSTAIKHRVGMSSALYACDSMTKIIDHPRKRPPIDYKEKSDIESD